MVGIFRMYVCTCRTSWFYLFCSLIANGFFSACRFDHSIGDVKASSWVPAPVQWLLVLETMLFLLIDVGQPRVAAGHILSWMLNCSLWTTSHLAQLSDVLEVDANMRWMFNHYTVKQWIDICHSSSKNRIIPFFE